MDPDNTTKTVLGLTELVNHSTNMQSAYTGWGLPPADKAGVTNYRYYGSYEDDVLTCDKCGCDWEEALADYEYVLPTNTRSGCTLIGVTLCGGCADWYNENCPRLKIRVTNV